LQSTPRAGACAWPDQRRPADRRRCHRPDDRRQRPQKNLAPAHGTSDRYKLQEWLNFIASELHKNFSPLFQPVLSDETKAFFKDRLMGKFKYVDQALKGRDYVMGDAFTVPDAYLFTMLAWAERVGLDISGLPNLVAYKARVAARPKVQEALTAEGLLKAS
jgi:glutathione S-transferase